MPVISLNTIGCKLNYAESSALLNLFRDKGFIVANDDDLADICIINTCSVTENAEKECRQIVRRALRKNPDAFIIVTGCYAQLRSEEIQKIHGVDLILGTNEKFQILNFVSELNKKDKAEIFVSEQNEIHNIFGAFTDFSTERTRAFLKIQDGCDYKCSYCTIPMARGRSRSLSNESVLNQFIFLLQQGYKEIVLTGVNVGDYGRRIGNNLFGLLEKMTQIEGDFRIRISSIEPNLLSDEIIELTKSSDKLCKHFHIPLQSGNDKILQVMKRCYKSDFYKDLIFKIKNEIPDCGIGIDVIVGFPGETEEDFIVTKNFIESLPVSYLHVFTFSERPGTKAFMMSNNIEKKVRKERTNILRKISIQKRQEFFDSNIDRCVKVLFETYDTEKTIKGFSSNYIRILHNSNVIKENSFVNILIDRAENEICFGQIIK